MSGVSRLFDELCSQLFEIIFVAVSLSQKVAPFGVKKPRKLGNNLSRESPSRGEAGCACFFNTNYRELTANYHQGKLNCVGQVGQVGQKNMNRMNRMNHMWSGSMSKNAFGQK